MKGRKVGFALCGSFCTINDVLEQLISLAETEADITPIMSEIVYSTDTRFTDHTALIEKVKNITNKDIIHTVAGAEPIGPKALLDVLIVAPCTGNTIGKIAGGITDTAVTMAVKAHLRNNRPVVLAIATNDALSASAKNIGVLLNTKNIYFVPFGQDNAQKKPTSMIADFSKIIETARLSLEGKQIQPIFSQSI